MAQIPLSPMSRSISPIPPEANRQLLLKHFHHDPTPRPQVTSLLQIPSELDRKEINPCIDNGEFSQHIDPLEWGITIWYEKLTILATMSGSSSWKLTTAEISWLCINKLVLKLISS
jgi:hypothetical protein